MQGIASMKCSLVAVCFLMLAAQVVSGAPSYSDYENVRDLYEMLLQKEAIENRIGGPQQLQPQQQQQLLQQGGHEIVRKSNRSPSLRLRFGRRADPLMAGAAFSEHSAMEGPAENN